MQLFIIATAWQGVDLSIEVIEGRLAALKRLNDIFTDSVWDGKAGPDDDPEQFVADFFEFCREENDNMTGDLDIAIDVINVHVPDGFKAHIRKTS